MNQRIQKTFYYVLLITALIKILLSAIIPITGDEAYFVTWGRHLDFGFYDHPPMAGWIMKLMLYLGSSTVILRLPATLVTIAVGYLMYRFLKPHNQTKAFLVATLFLVSPINILNVLISTDTPIFLFSFLSAIFLYKALQTERQLFYLLSGVFLGCAFLSKYFAALLGLSYLIYFLFSDKKKSKTSGFILLFATLIPFVALNLYWNYTHSWANIMFNVFNRNQQESLSLTKVFKFVASQAYLITPPILYYVYRFRKKFKETLFASPFVLFSFLFLFPLALLGLLSIKKVIGLHWVFSFYPFMYILVFHLLDENALIKSIKFMAVFTLIHLLFIGTILSIPLQKFKYNKHYYEIVLGMRTDKVLDTVRSFGTKFILMSPSYTDSAILAFHGKKDVPVFDSGSHHGRQDDFLTDFKQLDGRNFLILKKSKPDLDRYFKYFDRVEIKYFAIEKVRFTVVLGFGFRYEPYRKEVLSHIAKTYYDIPKFLPGKCIFHEKYSL